MTASKVSKLRGSDMCDGYNGFGYEVKNNGVCGRKRGLFECDVCEEPREFGGGVVVSSPRKKTTLSRVVCDEGEKIRPYKVVGRESSFDDGEVEGCEVVQEGFSGVENDLEYGEIDQEGFSRVANVMMSRWVCDDELGDLGACSGKEKGKGFVEGKVVGERSSSCESVVTEREGSNGVGRRSWGSKSRDEDDCSVGGVEVDDSMEVDVCDDIGMMRCMPGRCRSVRDEYDNVGKISEGAYGVVYKARGKKSKELVALKKLKLGNEKEGFPAHFLREINILLSINHPSIVNVREVVMDETRHGLGDVYLVMDYVEHDLQALMEARKRRFSQSEVKCLMLQLLEGVRYLHDNWLIHRDLKTSNLLYNNQGELKICDFGMSRQYGSPLKPYTALVVTLWYRAPELLLGAKEYSTAVDMWSVGCIMSELLTAKPFFEGKNELDQLDKVFRKLGTPNEKIWPGYSELPGVKINFVHQPYNLLHKEFPRASFMSSPTLSDLGLDLLSRLLTYDPEKRITAEEALNHRWFQEVPLPTSKEFMPTFPATPTVL